MKKILPIIAIALLLLPMVAVNAAPAQSPISYQPPSGQVTIESIVVRITNMLYNVFLLSAVLILIIAAFTFLFSGGSSDKVGKARGMLVIAIIAIVIAILARFVIPMVASLLGQQDEYQKTIQ